MWNVRTMCAVHYDRILLIPRVSSPLRIQVKAASVSSTEETSINSGYLTVGIVDQRTGRPVQLPPTEPPKDDQDARMQHDQAMLRRQLRIQRRQMFSLRSDAMQFSQILMDDGELCDDCLHSNPIHPLDSQLPISPALAAVAR